MNEAEPICSILRDHPRRALVANGARGPKKEAA